jgi:hypothetical protein
MFRLKRLSSFLSLSECEFVERPLWNILEILGTDYAPFVAFLGPNLGELGDRFAIGCTRFEIMDLTREVHD